MKYITLSNGKQTIVDDEDFEELSKYRWHFTGGYAFRHKNNKKEYIHRILNETPHGLVTDHINRNKLDNRKSNLRSATVSQNGANAKKKDGCRSKYKGVTWHKPNSTWKARITVKGKEIYLGYYKEEVDAGVAYAQAVAYYYDEFARPVTSGF